MCKNLFFVILILTFVVVFIGMGKKERHIRIRLSEAQFQALADYLVQEERTKSAVLREALNTYLLENRQSNANRNLKEGYH